MSKSMHTKAQLVRSLRPSKDSVQYQIDLAHIGLITQWFMEPHAFPLPEGTTSEEINDALDLLEERIDRYRELYPR